MARVTVEDCLDHVLNRFELVIVAAKRTRQLLDGVEPKVKFEEDKCTVTALREIGQGLIASSGDVEIEEVEEGIAELGESEPDAPVEVTESAASTEAAVQDQTQ